MADEPRVVEADHYRETRAKLKADPIIQSMADEVAIHGATEVDMLAALREYQRRGGTIDTHIGGPAQAIKELLGADKK